MNRNQRALALVAVFIISMLVYSSTLYLITANHIQFKLFTRNNDYNNDFGSESGNWTNSSDDFSGSGSGSGRRESKNDKLALTRNYICNPLCYIYHNYKAPF